MRYVVMGARAIGGGVGGLLHRVGIETTMVARGEHLRALQAGGLRLHVGEEPETALTVPVVAAPAEVEITDQTVVLLAVKSQHTATALDALVPHLRPETPVVSLQNGVSNERALSGRVSRVYSVTVMMPASHLEPGRVRLHSAGRPALLDIGRYPTGVDDVARAIAADLRAAGFESEPRADIMAWKYRKLIVNLGNAVDAACPVDDDFVSLVQRLHAEAESVLAAAGIPVVSEETDQERRGQLLRPLVDRAGVGSSTWQSVRRGTGDVEVDHLNGEIVRLGRLHGVPTPANELVRRTLHDVVRRVAAPQSVPAARLLGQLDQSALS